jgi:hypothetical protein
MKVAVIGSRSFQDKKLLEMELSKIDITELISGGAKGADNLAENYAEANDIPVKIFLPDYARFGRGAHATKAKSSHC